VLAQVALEKLQETAALVELQVVLLLAMVQVEQVAEIQLRSDLGAGLHILLI
jgi:hypothetical protein